MWGRMPPTPPSLRRVRSIDFGSPKGDFTLVSGFALRCLIIGGLPPPKPPAYTHPPPNGSYIF